MWQCLVMFLLFLLATEIWCFSRCYFQDSFTCTCHRSCFYLQVRVEGFNYVGMGNSTNKKDAQTNAARDFVNYLVRVNEMKKEEIPSFGVSCCVPLKKEKPLIAVLCLQLHFSPGVQSGTRVLWRRLNVQAFRLQCWKAGIHSVKLVGWSGKNSCVLVCVIDEAGKNSEYL